MLSNTLAEIRVVIGAFLCLLKQAQPKIASVAHVSDGHVGIRGSIRGWWARRRSTLKPLRVKGSRRLSESPVNASLILSIFFDLISPQNCAIDLP